MCVSAENFAKVSRIYGQHDKQLNKCERGAGAADADQITGIISRWRSSVDYY
jgi:hypothetical protein